MNAFSWLEPIFVSPVAEIERGFLRSPKSYVLVVSKKSLQHADKVFVNSEDYEDRLSDDVNNDEYYDDDNYYGNDGDDGDFNTNNNRNGDAAEIIFFDVHQDAAKWLLDASYNAGYELLKRGNSNVEFRLGKFDLRGPPRGEGSTMASIFIVDESSPRIFSFESSLRRDIFLRTTRSFVSSTYRRGGSGGIDDYDNEYYDNDRSYFSDDDDEEEEEDPNMGAVVWDKKSYEVPPEFESEVVPAKGVLSLALSSANQNQQNQSQSTNLTQREELHLAREMMRNPIFHRRADLAREQQNQQQQQQQGSGSGSSSSIENSIPISAPAQAPTGIFNLPLFQAECANKIAATDIKIASLIVNESDRWLDMLQDIQQLDEETILHLEARIENFSHELLSRRSIIDEIEKESLMRQQIKKNLTQVITQLKGVNTELSFTRSAKKAIETLNAIQLSSTDELEKAIRTNAISLEDGKNTVETVLATRKLIESKYSKLQAIVDRCEQFKIVRRDIARRIRAAIMHSVLSYNNNNNNNTTDQSSQNSTSSSSILTAPKIITLLPPYEFFSSIEHYSGFMDVVRASDLAGYYSSARAIAKRVNETAVPQIGKFFMEIRRRVAQMPSMANLRFSSGRQMNFDVDDFASSNFVMRLYHSYELTPTELIPSAKTLKEMKKKQNNNNNSSQSQVMNDNDEDQNNTFISGGDGSTVSSLTVVPLPKIQLSDARDAIAVLMSETKSFKYFFALLDKETRTNESYKTGLLNRLIRGGEDPWACRADIAIACCAKAVTDLVLSVRNFFVQKYKLMSIQPSNNNNDGSSSSSSWTSILQSNSAAFSASPESQDGKSLWERADEVNTFLWLCFRREGKNNLRSSAAMEFGWELVRLTEFVFSKCDLIFSIPIASILESLIDRIDDGDSVSSKPISQRHSSSHDGGETTSTSARPTAGSSSSPDEKQQQTPATERSGFLSHVLAASLTIAHEKLNLYIAVQIEAMRNSARTLALKGSKVEILLPSFLVFPIALNRIETLLSQQFYPSYSAFEMFLNSIVPQMFSTLDAVTFRDDPSVLMKSSHYLHQGAGGDTNMEVVESLLPAQDSDFIQFVHHSLFCVAVRNSVLARTREILRGRLSFSEARRDQYEQRYILRSLFAKCFPQFAATAEVADGIIKRTINDAEADSSLRNMFEVQKVTKLCGKSIPQELPLGISRAKEKARRHVARLVSSGDLSISLFLVELVKTSLDHLLMHLTASLAVVERVRSIVTPTENRQFESECLLMLRELSS